MRSSGCFHGTIGRDTSFTGAGVGSGMKIDFAVVSDYALVDQYGKLSVMGIFQHIWVPQFPALHPRLHLVLRVKGRRTEIGEHRVRIRFTGDDGNQILSGDGTVNFA